MIPDRSEDPSRRDLLSVRGLRTQFSPTGASFTRSTA